MNLKSVFSFSLLFLLTFWFSGQAQDLYTPRNVKAAFEKGTRAKDGKPGLHYWQNHGRYDIQVMATPPSRTIIGSEQITYFNESPDTLRQIVLRLWLNFHKPEAPHLGYMAPERLNDGIQFDQILVNGKLFNPKKLTGGITTKNILLSQPLMPKDSIHLSIDWHYEIALKSGREGMIDSATYYIAYFYPRVSVYDDYNGWDRLDFTGYQEFYNDFNDYTFSVTVPKNYLVWATGVLQNPEEVLQPPYLEKLKKAHTADQVIHIATKADLDKKQITAQNPTNTWKWKAQNVTDVAIAISNHYNWDAGSELVDALSGRRADMQAAYNDTSKDFHQMVAFGKAALSWFSKNWPGVSYPYPKMTAVQGYADMEYPMMINDASTPDLDFSQFVANHEIAHTYFPFYMGTNESRYAFMDEGWATTFEYLIGQAQIGKEKAASWYKNFRVNRWIHDPSQEEQVPIITPSNIERGMAYGSNAYVKPSLGYLALKDMLGDKLFRKCLLGYIERWHGKHPIPWDFFYSFNNLSEKDLNWFWNSWFFSHGYDDLTLQSVKRKGNTYTINIYNTGGFPNPFDLKISFEDGSKDSRHFTSIVWKENQKETSVSLKYRKKVTAIKIDNGIWMDANPEDNIWKAQ